MNRLTRSATVAPNADDVLDLEVERNNVPADAGWILWDEFNEEIICWHNERPDLQTLLNDLDAAGYGDSYYADTVDELLDLLLEDSISEWTSIDSLREVLRSASDFDRFYDGE